MNKSRMTIVCFLMAIILVIGCLTSCGVSVSDHPVARIGVPTAIIPTAESETAEPTATVEENTTVATTEPTTDLMIGDDLTELKVEKPKAKITKPKKTKIKKVVVKKKKVKKKKKSIALKLRYNPSYFKRMGVLHWGGWRWTYYSQRVLPGHGLKIPGRHVNAKGYVCDKKGYICLASSALPKGRKVKTPLGKWGRVYDCGCASNTLDVYVDW